MKANPTYSPTPMQRNRVAILLLTAALVLVFGWFGIEKFTTPINWIGWIPLWMEGLLGMPRETWLMIIGATEILFAILLLVPIRNVKRAGAIFIALQLLSILPIVGFNEIGVRDFAILLSAVALAILL